MSIAALLSNPNLMQNVDAATMVATGGGGYTPPSQTPPPAAPNNNPQANGYVSPDGSYLPPSAAPTATQAQTTFNPISATLNPAWGGAQAQPIDVHGQLRGVGILPDQDEVPQTPGQGQPQPSANAATAGSTDDTGNSGNGSIYVPPSAPQGAGQGPYIPPQQSGMAAPPSAPTTLPAPGTPASNYAAATSTSGNGTDADLSKPITDPKQVAALQGYVGGAESSNNYQAPPNTSVGPDGKTSTASGRYQYLKSTWQQDAAAAGVDINQYPEAYKAPPAVQDQVFAYTLAHRGLDPWKASSNKWGPLAQKDGIVGAGGFTGQFGSAGGGSAVDPAAAQAAPGAGPGGYMSPQQQQSFNDWQQMAKDAASRIAAFQPPQYSRNDMLLRAGLAMAGGKTFADSMGGAGNAFGQMREFNMNSQYKGMELQNQLADIGIRGANQVSDMAYKGAQLGIDQQRVNNETLPTPVGGVGIGPNGQGAVTTFDKRTGQFTTTSVPQMPGQVYRYQNAGTIAGAQAGAKSDVTAWNDAVDGKGYTDDQKMLNAANGVKQLIASDPNIFGTSWSAQMQRKLAAITGGPVANDADVARKNLAQMMNSYLEETTNGHMSSLRAAQSMKMVGSAMGQLENNPQALGHIADLVEQQTQARMWVRQQMLAHPEWRTNGAVANESALYDQYYSAHPQPDYQGAGAGSAQGATQPATAATQAQSVRPLAGTTSSGVSYKIIPSQ